MLRNQNSIVGSILSMSKISNEDSSSDDRYYYNGGYDYCGDENEYPNDSYYYNLDD